jgi:hypothetical protein
MTNYVNTAVNGPQTLAREAVIDRVFPHTAMLELNSSDDAVLTFRQFRDLLIDQACRNHCDKVFPPIAGTIATRSQADA